MSYLNLKFRVDFLGHVKNFIINILFFTVNREIAAISIAMIKTTKVLYVVATSYFAQEMEDNVSQ